MLELTENEVQRWGRSIGIGSLRLAEQDYRLVELVRAINEDDFLASRLVFKGGTALNKLYFGGNARLSVDLDFNILGTRDSVQDERDEIRSRLKKVLEDQNPEFEIFYDDSWESLQVTGRYQPLAGGGREKIKIDLATVERFPITEIITKPLTTPDGGTVSVRTLPIDELIATKIRAFYSRRKGRDLYDLIQARPLLDDTTLVRKMAIYYFYRAKIVYDPDLLEEAMSDPRQIDSFRQDLDPFLRADADFDVEDAIKELPRAYDFLFDLDDRDNDFILWARYHLDKVSKETASKVLDHDHPLARLLENQSGISDRARNATPADIYVQTEE